MKNTSESILVQCRANLASRATVIANGLLLGSLLLLPMGYPVEAQTITASATLTAQPAGLNFDYTLTLNNSAASTVSIETFWYAWVPGEDFLPSRPLSFQLPTGWSENTTGGTAGDGYGLQFVTSSTPVSPGSSLTFQFDSPDSPAALAGNSPFYPTTPVGTSVVYQGSPFIGASATFVAQSVPEPSAVGLLLVGGLPFVFKMIRRCKGRP